MQMVRSSELKQMYFAFNLTTEAEILSSLSQSTNYMRKAGKTNHFRDPSIAVNFGGPFNKTMIFPEHHHSIALSIVCTNKSINNCKKILKDSVFTQLKLVNPTPRLEKIPSTQQKYSVNYS